MALQSVQALPSSNIPYLGSLVEGACSHSVTEGIVECHTIEDVLVADEGEHLFAGVCVPQFACPVIAARNEPAQTRLLHIPALVEGTVCEGLLVHCQFLEEGEFLVLVAYDLLLKF